MSYFEEQATLIKEALQRAESQEDSNLIDQAMHDAIAWYLSIGDYDAAAVVTVCLA